jgi:biopolymer transport protein ExbD
MLRLRHQSHSAGESFSHGIDLAPMLDFVVNLLIFFIITAVFVKESGLMVNRPSEFEQRREDQKSIQIQVLANGEVWLDNRVVDVRAVRANVERASAVNPDSGVLIVSEEQASTGLLVDVVDQVHLGGVYNITFTTQGG